MSADWKAGDKAICVDGSPPAWPALGDVAPKLGTIYLVREVVEAVSPSLEAGIALRVGVGNEGVGAWCATRFRKIVPACDHATNEQTKLMPHEGFWRGRTDLP